MIEAAEVVISASYLSPQEHTSETLNKQPNILETGSASSFLAMVLITTFCFLVNAQ